MILLQVFLPQSPPIVEQLIKTGAEFPVLFLGQFQLPGKVLRQEIFGFAFLPPFASRNYKDQENKQGNDATEHSGTENGENTTTGLYFGRNRHQNELKACGVINSLQNDTNPLVPCGNGSWENIAMTTSAETATGRQSSENRQQKVEKISIPRLSLLPDRIALRRVVSKP